MQRKSRAGLVRAGSEAVPESVRDDAVSREIFEMLVDKVILQNSLSLP